MKVRVSPGRDEFISRNLENWLAREAENGALIRLKNAASAYREVFLEVIREGDEVVQTAYVNPSDQIIFSRADRDSLRALATFLYDEGITFPGIFAPHPSSTWFAEAYARISGVSFRTSKQMIHMILAALSENRRAEGRLRKAEHSDREMVAKFRQKAQAEGNTLRPFDSLQSVDRDLESGSLYVWEDQGGSIVSAAAVFNERSPHTGYIDHVFTRPEARKQGFGSAIVRELSLEILKSGRMARLSVDATNTSAVRVYEALGFTEECRMDNLRT